MREGLGGLVGAKMFTRLPANAHLLLMCIWLLRQHSRASTNIYNDCLVSPRYHGYLRIISSLHRLPPTLHWTLDTGLEQWQSVVWSLLFSSIMPLYWLGQICGLILVISVVGRVALNCPVNQILIIAVFVFTSQGGGRGGWGSRLEIYLSVINHRT